MSERVPRIAALRGPAALRARLLELDLPLPCDDEIDPAVLSAPLDLGPGVGAAPNRWVIQPMEGWDANADGSPSELTERRWRHFGQSGAGWIWGGEAVAVREDGRANPNQLRIGADTAAALGGLRRALLRAADESDRAEPVVGLQLTHSGRWSMPTAGRRAPRIAFRHAILDRRVGVESDAAVLSDGEVATLVGDFAEAARLAQAEGFAFVDIKHCHGYLLHEFLSARQRGGRYGGPGLADRMRLTEEIVAAVGDAAPGLRLGVRLSLFDTVPHRSLHDRGVMEPHPLPYSWGFGVDADHPDRSDLSETVAFARRLSALGVTWINATASSPYYAPHLQRPAAFPPSDGYPPPEDPLCGVARLLDAARALKRAVPEVLVVSSGWSYLQEFIPHVAQACIRDGWFDAVGLGRMVLSYPDLPADVAAGRDLARKRICRTFSDCTSAPRNGLISGCYPLDPFYRARPERAVLERTKRAAKPSQ